MGINIIAFLSGEVFLNRDRERLRELTTISAASAEDQAEIWRLVVKLDDESHRRLAMLLWKYGR